MIEIITKKSYENLLFDADLESKKRKYKDTERREVECKYFIKELPVKKQGELKEIKKSMLVCIESINMGSSKWSKWQHHLRIVNVKKFIRETNCYYFFEDEKGKTFQIKKENIVCVVK